MFFHHRHHSYYPAVIALLSLALGVLMFLTLRQSPSSDETPPSPSAVTEADYRTEAHAVVAPFLAGYQSAPTDVARLVAVEDALAGLTALTVPATYRDAHLGLAVSFALMRDGLRGEDGALDNGYARLLRLVGDYPWLAE